MHGLIFNVPVSPGVELVFRDEAAHRRSAVCRHSVGESLHGSDVDSYVGQDPLLRIAVTFIVADLSRVRTGRGDEGTCGGREAVIYKAVVVVSDEPEVASFRRTVVDRHRRETVSHDSVVLTDKASGGIRCPLLSSSEDTVAVLDSVVAVSGNGSDRVEMTLIAGMLGA